MLAVACRYSATAEKAANRAVDSASTLVEQLKITQLTALDIAPQEVKDSQWYKDFRNGVNNFNQTGQQPLSPHLLLSKLTRKHMRHCSGGSVVSKAVFVSHTSAASSPK